jgi:acetolactate synthase I/II/III large subunit
MVSEATSSHAPKNTPERRPRRMSGAQILFECLLREGVDTIFGYPGGKVINLYHALPEFPIRHVLVRHEQGAGFAACGYARVTGRVGVCLATSGPGATNLVTPIADAMMDSVPIVAITGQVPTSLVGKDAFQEIDTTGITLPITKHNYLVDRVEDLPRVIREAFYIASTGRPGPVLIDSPQDVQAKEIEFHWPEEVRLAGYRPTVQGNVRQIRQAAELISSAKRPLLIAGHGVVIARAFAELKTLAETADIPVATTLHGISSFPESHDLSFGLLGMHGAAYANKAVQAADLLIAVGMRFDDRVTGALGGFAPKAKIVHIDVDPAEIGKNVHVTTPIVGDVRKVLAALNAEISSATHSDWIEQLRDWRRETPMTAIRETEKLLPQHVIRGLYEATKGNAIICADVGQNQMFAAQHYVYDKPNSYITSGGLGSMGVALPSAIGAQMALPEENVWVVVGDGGIQMNIQELGTIVQERLPIKIALINNSFLGMVRQWQEFFFEKRYSATPIGCPDFVALAEAYGIRAMRVADRAGVGPAIAEAMAHDGPALIEFLVEEEENVYPMIPPGGSLSDIINDPANEEVLERDEIDRLSRASREVI